MSKTYIPAELRRQVRLRAREGCEYCLVPESIAFRTYHVDHIISEKHLGTTELDNLAMACPACNLYKGSDIATRLPKSNMIVRLYNPRRDIWNDHFRLTEEGLLLGSTQIAKGTIQLLQLNGEQIVMVRKDLLETGFKLVP